MAQPWANLSWLLAQGKRLMLYIVQGVDHNGRKFAGLYTIEEARDLASASRLNVVRDRYTHAVIHLTNQPKR